MASEHDTARSRSQAIEAALDRLIAYCEVAERTAIDSDALAPARAQIAECKRALLSLPLPQQPGFAEKAETLEASISDATKALLRADFAAPIGTFRRKLSPDGLSPETLAAYARVLAGEGLDGGPRQQRFELAVMYALFSQTATLALEARPEAQRSALLNVILDGLPGDASRRAEAVAHFDAAREKLAQFDDAEEMFAANVDRDVKRFKRTLGNAALDRPVLEAMTRFEAAYRSRACAIPASSQPLSLPPGPKKISSRSMKAVRSPVLSAHGLAAVVARAIADVQAEIGEVSIIGARAVELSDAKQPASPPVELDFEALAEAEAEAEAALSDEDVVVDPRDRVEAIRDVLGMLKDVGLDPERVKLVEDTLVMCEESLGRLDGADAENRDERLASFENVLDIGEHGVLSVDATLSMAAFRSWFDRQLRSRAFLLRYARLLGRALHPRDVQRDRLELVVSRLLSKTTPDGGMEMMPRNEAAKILTYILHERRHVADHERANAVMFFREASLSLASLTTLDEVFSGGFYLDVRGYKVALREQMMDPDILYAAVTLNVAIHNRVEHMRAQEDRSKRSLHSMLERHDEEVEKVLNPTSLTTDERFEETRRYLEKYRENVGRALPRRQLDPRILTRVVLAAVIGIGAVIAIDLYTRDVNDLDWMSDASLHELSEVLESGALSSGESRRTFIGTVDSSAWADLDEAERREAGERIRARLTSQGVTAAFITDQGRQAIHIADGDLVAIQ